MSDHPHYPHNTIQEALVEFRLKLGAGFAWSPKLPGLIFTALGPDKFPGMEPIKEIGIELTVDQATGQTNQRLVEGPPRVRYTNADQTEMVQVSTQVFAYNRIRSYDCWDDMLTRTLETWHVVQRELGGPNIERIGLRYINAFSVGTADSVGDWLKPSDFIPPAVTRTNGAVFGRIECQLRTQDRIVVTAVRQEKDTSQLMLDIDCSRTIEETTSELTVKEILIELHESVWEVFRDAQGERLKSYLEEGR